MSKYAFVWKPKWILGHLIVLALVIGFLNAGFWQLNRLQERQQFNDQVVANMEAPIAPIDQVLPPGADFDDATAALNRQVVAEGTYLVDEEIVIAAQASPDGVPGVWIVSPLQLADGRILLVNRGWLASTGDITEPPAGSAATEEPVVVSGWISETQVPSDAESREPDVDHQAVFLRIDVDRIQRQFSAPLVPAFLLRDAQEPADPGPDEPVDLALPALTTGPHLGYVIQWFGFTLVALVGYPLLLWLIGRERDRPAPSEVDPDDLPPGAFVDEHGVIDMTGVPAGGPPRSRTPEPLEDAPSG